MYTTIRKYSRKAHVIWPLRVVYAKRRQNIYTIVIFYTYIFIYFYMYKCIEHNSKSLTTYSKN